ncbi:MAG: hypothetical protein JWN01_1067 [Patescibacteria group bacterium]|nr:hypothetical protein [Patescibacteria group bacterium]
MEPTQPTSAPTAAPVITPRLIKKIVISFLIISFFGVALNLLLTNGQLTLDVQGKGSTPMTITLIGDKHTKAKTLKLSQSGQQTLWLPIDNYTIALDQDHRNTIAPAQVQAFKKTTTTLTARDEAASAKLAGESTGCGFTSSGVYYSYECAKPTNIYRHTAAGKQPISSDEYSSVTPLGTNIIASVIGDDGMSFYSLEPGTGKKTLITKPSALRDIPDPEGVHVVPNQILPSTYQFALIEPTSNTWYLYRNPSDQAPLKVSPETIKSNLAAISRQLTGDQISTYYGPKPTEEGTETATSKDGEFTIYSLTSKKTTFRAVLPELSGIINLQLTSPTTAIAQLTKGGVVILTLGRDALQTTGTFSDGKNLTVNNKKVVFSRGSSVYELDADTATSYRLFEAKGFNYSNFNLSGNSVIMQAFTGQQGQENSGMPSAFSLNLDKPATYPRPEWSLPQPQPVKSTDSQSTDQTTPDTSGGTPTYIGTDKLIEIGVTSFQLDDLKYALNQYYTRLGKNLTNATIDITTIDSKPHQPDTTTRDVVNFNIKLNDQLLKAKMEYYDISGIRLYLTNPSNNSTVYDSQDLDISS